MHHRYARCDLQSLIHTVLTYGVKQLPEQRYSRRQTTDMKLMNEMTKTRRAETKNENMKGKRANILFDNF